MVRIVAVSILLALLFAAVLAPASLFGKFLFNESSELKLYNSAGTIWNGEAEVSWLKNRLGKTSWNLNFQPLLSGVISYSNILKGSKANVEMDIVADWDANLTFLLNGIVQPELLNQMLKNYRIQLFGEISLENTEIKISEDRLFDLAGNIYWSGGPVTYELSGFSLSSNLPAMTVNLGPELTAFVYERDTGILLIRAEVMDTNFVKIGITKGLSDLLGYPWPDKVDQNKIILEVEEKVSNIRGL